VRADIEEAQNIGVRGVPFFVMDRAYAVSGAQLVEVFTETLEKTFEGWKAKKG
jgi:protein disulfide-isomerase